MDSEPKQEYLLQTRDFIPGFGVMHYSQRTQRTIPKGVDLKYHENNIRILCAYNFGVAVGAAICTAIPLINAGLKAGLESLLK
jgi:hypothetical protein